MPMEYNKLGTILIDDGALMDAEANLTTAALMEKDEEIADVYNRSAIALDNAIYNAKALRRSKIIPAVIEWHVVTTILNDEGKYVFGNLPEVADAVLLALNDGYIVTDFYQQGKLSNETFQWKDVFAWSYFPNHPMERFN